MTGITRWRVRPPVKPTRPGPFSRARAEAHAAEGKHLEQRCRLRETLLAYAEAAIKARRWEAATAYQTAADLVLAYEARVG